MEKGIELIKVKRVPFERKFGTQTVNVNYSRSKEISVEKPLNILDLYVNTFERNDGYCYQINNKLVIDYYDGYYCFYLDFDLKNLEIQYHIAIDYLIDWLKTDLSSILFGIVASKSNGLHLWFKIKTECFNSKYEFCLFYECLLKYCERRVKCVPTSILNGSIDRLELWGLDYNRVFDRLFLSNNGISNSQITLLTNSILLRNDNITGKFDVKNFVTNNVDCFEFDGTQLKISDLNVTKDSQNIIKERFLNPSELLKIENVDFLLKSNSGRGKLARLFFMFYGLNALDKSKEYIENNRQKLQSLLEKNEREKEFYEWVKRCKSDKILNIKKTNSISKYIDNSKFKENELLIFDKIVHVDNYIKDKDLEGNLNNQKNIISSSTGAGKTTSLINYFTNKNQKTLFVVPNVSVIMSIYEIFGNKIDIYFNTENHKDWSNKVTDIYWLFNREKPVFVITYEKFNELLNSAFINNILKEFENIVLDEIHQINIKQVLNFIQYFNANNTKIILSTATPNKLFYLKKYYDYYALYFDNNKKLDKSFYVLDEKKSRDKKISIIENAMSNNDVVLVYENNKKETTNIGKYLKEKYKDWNIELFNSENKPNSFYVNDKTVILCTSSLISGANLYLSNPNTIPFYLLLDSSIDRETITQISGRFRNQKTCNVLYVCSKEKDKKSLKPIPVTKENAVKSLLSVSNYVLNKEFNDTARYVFVGINNEKRYNDVLFVNDVWVFNNKIGFKEYCDLFDAVQIKINSNLDKKSLDLLKETFSNKNEILENNDNNDLITNDSDITFTDLSLDINYFFNDSEKDSIKQYFKNRKINNSLPTKLIKERKLFEKISTINEKLNKIKSEFGYEFQFNESNDDVRDYLEIKANYIIEFILKYKLIKDYFFESKVVRVGNKIKRVNILKDKNQCFKEYLLNKMGIKIENNELVSLNS